MTKSMAEAWARQDRLAEQKRKIVIKCNEPCYIIGIASITPYVDYSQGNDWYYDAGCYGFCSYGQFVLYGVFT